MGGCPRSGTSLVRRILGSHSRIHCGPEVKFFADLNGAPEPDPAHFMPSALALWGRGALLEVLGRGFVELHERAARVAKKPRWADKVPENVLQWRDWQGLLADSWLLVQVVRNPLDTLASLQEARFPELPGDLGSQIVLYREYIEAGAEFKAEHPDRYLLVVYEELVTRPHEALAALMSSLGEILEPEQLRFNQQPHEPGIEDFKVQYTDAIHDDSLHRWPEVLSVADAEMIWDLTHDLWTEIDRNQSFVAAPNGP